MENKTKQNVFIKLLENINIKACVVMFVVLTLIPILYLSFFSFPVADDYDFGIRTKAVVETGSLNLLDYIKAALDTVVFYYNSWQGMYSITFISALQPGVFGERFYFLTPIIMIAICLISYLYTGKRLLWLIKVDKKTAIFLSFVCWNCFFQTIPNPREGMFWFNGAFAYIGFLSITMMNLTILLVQYKNKPNTSIIALTSLVAIFISGGSVPVAFFNIMFMVLILGYILFFDKIKSNCIPFVFPVIAAVIGFIIICVAPGNAIRQSAVLNTPTILETILKVGLISYFEFAFGEWFSLSLVLLLLFLTPYIINITKKLSGFTLQKLILLILAQYMLVCGMLCTPYYGMGEVGNFGGGKAINVVYAVFFVCVIIIYGYTVGLLQEKKILTICIDKIPPIYQKIIAVFFSAIVFLGIFFYGSNYYGYSTSGLAISEIIGGVNKTYKQQMDQRLKIFNDDSIKDVVLEPHVYSVFFGYDVLNVESNLWPNTSVARYYGKDSVSLKDVE